MNTITRLVVYAIISLTFATTHAQDKEVDSLKKTSVDYKIESLEALKTKIEKEEREYLKQEINKKKKKSRNLCDLCGSAVNTKLNLNKNT